MKIKGHAGYHSCSRCFLNGEYINKRTCFPFQEISSKERNHEEYVNRVQESHHVGNSLSNLTHISGFDMVNSFPLDYMHLVTLGLVKKLINLWVRGPIINVCIPSWKIKKITLNLSLLKPSIPSDFARKPRKLEDFSRWKATELRQFLISTGPLAL